MCVRIYLLGSMMWKASRLCCASERKESCACGCGCETVAVCYVVTSSVVEGSCKVASAPEQARVLHAFFYQKLAVSPTCLTWLSM
jgi:hypothetical protein